MSRIGKVPIPVPAGVQVSIADAEVKVKGPKGSLSVDTRAHVGVKLEGGQVLVERFNDESQSKAYHGLYQRLISNSITGVTKGFKKELELQGVGYKVAMAGKKLVLTIGYSHPIEFDPPTGITITAPKPTEVVVEGIDKQVVGAVAAKIRSFRPPEPYKGKGIRYKGEYVRRKQGKASAKGK